MSTAAKLACLKARRLPPPEAELLLRSHLERMKRWVAADHYVARQIINRLGNSSGTRETLTPPMTSLRKRTDSPRTRRENSVPERCGICNDGTDASTTGALRRGRQTSASRHSYPDSRYRLGPSHHPREPDAVNRVRTPPQRRLEDAAEPSLQEAETVQSTRADFRPALATGLTEVLEAWRADGGGQEYGGGMRRGRARISPLRRTRHPRWQPTCA